MTKECCEHVSHASPVVSEWHDPVTRTQTQPFAHDNYITTKMMDMNLALSTPIILNIGSSALWMKPTEGQRTATDDNETG